MKDFMTNDDPLLDEEGWTELLRQERSLRWRQIRYGVFKTKGIGYYVEQSPYHDSENVDTEILHDLADPSSYEMTLHKLLSGHEDIYASPAMCKDELYRANYDNAYFKMEINKRRGSINNKYKRKVKLAKINIKDSRKLKKVLIKLKEERDMELNQLINLQL
jgi:hypothetical protein